MKFLEKIRKLDLKKRKIIFWVVMIILGTLFFLLWIRITSLRLKNIQPNEFLKTIEPPRFEIPKIEIPTIPTLPPTPSP
jgi:hypothetical protein